MNERAGTSIPNISMQIIKELEIWICSSKTSSSKTEKSWFDAALPRLVVDMICLDRSGCSLQARPVLSTLIVPSRSVPNVPILYPSCTLFVRLAMQCNILTGEAVASKPRPVLSFLLLSPLNVPFFSVQALLSLPNYPFHTLATQRYGRLSVAPTGAMQSSPYCALPVPIAANPATIPKTTASSVSVLPNPCPTARSPTPSRLTQTRGYMHKYGRCQKGRDWQQLFFYLPHPLMDWRIEHDDKWWWW